ncbi:MAG TPA: hypothetical protein VLK58_02390 [Conexibacter sp.]|jgi:hypothetical protein|nr:hypothetical protein [Conexibacter sp.]
MASNLLAAAFLLVAAVLFFISGPWWSGALFLAASGCFLLAEMRQRR